MKTHQFITLFLLLICCVTWSNAQIKLAKVAERNKHKITCSAYSPDGKFVATGGMDNSICIWDATTGISFSELEGLKNFPISLTYSKDGKYLVSGDKAENVVIWDLQTGSIKHTLKEHKKTVRAVDISPDGKNIISASDDETIKMWDMASGQLIREFTGHKKEVNDLDYHISGKKFISAGFDNTIREWDVATGEEIAVVEAHDNRVRCVAYSPNGKRIASGGDDKKIQIWDANTKELQNTILAHKNWVETLTFSPDGKYLLSGSHDKYLILIEVVTGKIVFQSEKQDNYILSVDFRPDGQNFISAVLYSDELNIWDASSLEIQPLDEEDIKKATAKKKKAVIAWNSPKKSKIISGRTVYKIVSDISSENKVKKVTVMVNGSIYSTDEGSEIEYIEEEKIYRVQENIFLKEGSNQIVLVATNEAGDTESEVREIIYKPLEKPVVTWVSHLKDVYNVTNQVQNIQLCIQSAVDVDDIFVFVNGKLFSRDKNLVVDENQDCHISFSKQVELQTGQNTIRVAVANAAGQTSSPTLNFNYASAEKPEITWLNPMDDMVKSYVPEFQIGAFIKSESDFKAVGVYLNSELVDSKKDFTAESYNLTSELMLNEGENNINIVAINQGGKTVSGSKKVVFVKPTQTAINWIAPTSALTTTYQENIDIEACIKTDSKPQSVSITVNGNVVKELTDLVFATGEGCNVNINQNLILTEGENKLTIATQTATGLTKSDVKTIEYIKPVKASISWLKPVEANVTSDIPSYAIEACIKSQSDIAEIRLHNNEVVVFEEQNVSSGSDTECSYVLRQTVELKEGDNSIYLAVKNAAGIAQSNPVSINFEKAEEMIAAETELNEFKFALIIGNEDYSSFQTGLETEVDVDFAISDAKAFKEYAMKYLGVPEENIVFKTNARALDMLKAIKKMNLYAKNTFGQGEFIFYYAGHGLPHEKTKEPYLMPVDVGGSDIEFAIKLKDIYDKLTEHPTKRVTVFLDACFSGGGRNQGLVAARGVKIKAKEEMVESNLVVFTSSSGNQSSHPYKEKEHGLFTYYLLEKINETKGDVTYKELSDYVKQRVALQAIRKLNKEQHPQTNISPVIEDKWQQWRLNE